MENRKNKINKLPENFDEKVFKEKYFNKIVDLLENKQATEYSIHQADSMCIKHGFFIHYMDNPCKDYYNGEIKYISNWADKQLGFLVTYRCKTKDLLVVKYSRHIEDDLNHNDVLPEGYDYKHIVKPEIFKYITKEGKKSEFWLIDSMKFLKDGNKNPIFPPWREFSEGGALPNLHLKKGFIEFKNNLIKLFLTIKRFIYCREHDINVLGEPKQVEGNNFSYPVEIITERIQLFGITIKSISSKAEITFADKVFKKNDIIKTL